MSSNYKSSDNKADEPEGKHYAVLRKGRAILTIIKATVHWRRYAVLVSKIKQSGSIISICIFLSLSHISSNTSSAPHRTQINLITVLLFFPISYVICKNLQYFHFLISENLKTLLPYICMFAEC